MGKMKRGGAIYDGAESSSHSTTTRKIDNGYVVCESRCENGEYSSSERYSPTKPLIEERAADTNVGAESLRGAMKELKR